MAENRGGMRPTAPQNNPANVSGTGGAGQSGRAASGYAYGMNKQINEQAAGAPMAKAPRPTPGAQPMNVAPPQTPVTPLTAATMNPDEPVMAGINMGAGPGAEALMLPSNQENAAEFNNSISSYYPVLSYIASRPNTSPETRRALAILMNGL
jgi:hypothetical protein